MFGNRPNLEQVSRRNAQSSVVGPTTLLCRVLGRYKMFVDSQDVFITPHLVLDGYWESWISVFFAKVIKPGWVCVDAGAHWGYYTVLYSDLVGPGGKVIAFEPVPTSYDLLFRNAIVNGFRRRVVLHRCALSDHDGEDTIQLLNLNVGGAYLSTAADTPRKQALKEVSEGETVPVKVKRLDDFFGPKDKIDFIKIDVEGAEEKLWDGMQGVLANNRRLRIMLEYEQERYPDPGGFLQKIVDAGFKLQLINFNGDPYDVTADNILNSDKTIIHNLWLTRT